MQRGGFAIGVVVGLLSGLVLALGVALYIAKVPVPFVNKVPGRTAEQDQAEAERNRTWDPNAPLSGRAPGAKPPAMGGSAPAAAGVVVPAPGSAPTVGAPGAPGPAAATSPAVGAASSAAARPASAAGRDPAAILSGAQVPAAGASAPQRSTALGGEPFLFFVQAGAYTRSEDAEQQRARLGLMGHTANISEREQAGRVVYRVRLGPYRTRDDADALLVKLQAASVDAQIVRVERP